MNQKFKNHLIPIFLFTSFFFLWDVSLNFISLNYFKGVTANYLIVFLLLPIFYLFVKERNNSILRLFNQQKYITYLIIFIVAQFFLVNLLNNQIIEYYEIFNLFYFIILGIIYCHYRNFISENFEKILVLYLVIFICFSLYEQRPYYNVGQCNNKFFLIDIIQNIPAVNLSNSIYLENSHLAMMMVGVIFSSLFMLIKSKKNNIFLLFLLFISVIITILNYSTTFFIGYFFCLFIIFIFLYKKFTKKFWIYSFLFLIMNCVIFFTDGNCLKKITDFTPKGVIEKTLKKKADNEDPRNLTTLIYERSMILTLNTFFNHPLGWGNDGMDNATIDLLDKDEYENTYEFARLFNLKDGLSNFFKILTEFGFFSVFVCYFFLRYLMGIKKINSYNIFIITLFITLSIRGAGYFNGGFIFCIFEFFYLKELNKKNKITNQRNIL